MTNPEVCSASGFVFALPMKVAQIIIAIVVVGALAQSCGRVAGYEEEYDVAVLAFIESFSVPDSTTQQSIPVSLKGTFGETTAFSFDRINIVRTDSLFRIGVWGREVYKTGVQYAPKHVGIDTVLILTTSLKGIHFVEVGAAQGILRDSTIVY
jgi:hypothetical protein